MSPSALKASGTIVSPDLGIMSVASDGGGSFCSDISSFATLIAALVAIWAFFLARKDVKRAADHLRAQTVFQMQTDMGRVARDLREDSASKDSLKDRHFALLMMHYYALWVAWKKKILDGNDWHIVESDIKHMIKTKEFNVFWEKIDNRNGYPCKFRCYMDSLIE